MKLEFNIEEYMEAKLKKYIQTAKQTALYLNPFNVNVIVYDVKKAKENSFSARNISSPAF